MKSDASWYWVCKHKTSGGLCGRSRKSFETEELAYTAARRHWDRIHVTNHNKSFSLDWIPIVKKHGG